jgi:hypothetical protein
MSMEAPEEKLSRGSEAPTDTRPAYTFSFGPASVTSSIGQLTRKDVSLVPDALLEVWPEEQYGSSKNSWARSQRLCRKAYPAGKGTVTDDASRIEWKIEYAARKRHYPGIYEMQANVAVDESAKRIMASTDVREAFRLLNGTSDEGLNKREMRAALLERIGSLNAAVRRGLGAQASDYGGLMRLENLPMTQVTAETTRVQIDCH